MCFSRMPNVDITSGGRKQNVQAGSRFFFERAAEKCWPVRSPLGRDF